MDFGLSDIWWVLGKLQATKKFVLAGGKTVSLRLTVSQMRLKCVSNAVALATACRACGERVGTHGLRRQQRFASTPESTHNRERFSRVAFHD